MKKLLIAVISGLLSISAYANVITIEACTITMSKNCPRSNCTLPQCGPPSYICPADTTGTLTGTCPIYYTGYPANHPTNLHVDNHSTKQGPVIQCRSDWDTSKKVYCSK